MTTKAKPPGSPASAQARKREGQIKVEVVSGVQGHCLCFDDQRVAGPKPWGGGTVIHTFYVDPSDATDIAATAQERETTCCK
jgi:hypothetical protein